MNDEISESLKHNSEYDPLLRSFFDRETVEVSRDLLGKNLVRRTGGKILVARIVEVEAYLGEHDPAARPDWAL